jgi:hypothetical protein
MSSGFITSLMLSEDYVVHVLGFDRSTLNEGRYNMQFQQDIWEAHMIAEGWYSDGVKWLKDKGVKGYEAVKDAALEVPQAIKKFGDDAKVLWLLLLQWSKIRMKPKHIPTASMGIFECGLKD